MEFKGFVLTLGDAIFLQSGETQAVLESTAEDYNTTRLQCISNTSGWRGNCKNSDVRRDVSHLELIDESTLSPFDF